jgi:hypothetical protein
MNKKRPPLQMRSFVVSKTVGKKLAVFYPSGKSSIIRGVFVGTRDCEIEGKPGESVPLPTIRTTEDYREPGQQGVLYCPDGSPKVRQELAPALENPASVSALRFEQRFQKTDYLVPSGDEISFPRYVVIVDLDAPKKPAVSEASIPGHDGNEVLYRPDAGILKQNPLWPALALANENFPLPRPFLALHGYGREIRPRRYRYFAGKETGDLEGWFGYEGLQDTPEAASRRFIHAEDVPGKPAILLTAPAEILVNARPSSGKKITAAAGYLVAIGFDAFIVDLEANELVYSPPIVEDGDKAEYRRVTNLPTFPEGVVFPGTDIPVVNAETVPLVPDYGKDAIFEQTARVVTGRIGFEDAEEIREGILDLYNRYPEEMKRFCSLRVQGEWKDGYSRTFEIEEQPDADETIGTLESGLYQGIRVADIVLWEPEFLMEATGEQGEKIEAWKDKPLPLSLLRYTPRPQFHMLARGTRGVYEADSLDLWGLDRECTIVGWVIVPVQLTHPDKQKNLSPEERAAIESGGKVVWFDDEIGEAIGFYCGFVFCPVRTEEIANGAPVSRPLTSDECFYRIRWVFPVLCDREPPVSFAYPQIAALLEFMTSPRVEFNPEIDPNPPEEKPPRARSEDAAPAPNIRRSHILLRKLEISPEALARDFPDGLPESDGRKYGPLTEAHEVEPHFRKVRYGPGNCYVKTVAIQPYRSPKNPNIPLKEKTKKAVQPKHIRIAR